MTRAVLGTNILISAILFKGIPGRLLELAIAGSFRAVTSPTLLDELDEKLRGKFQLPTADADQIRSDLELLCDVVSTIDSLAVIQDDPGGDRVLECAVAGRADTIVSGDRHLLKLGSYDGTQILTVRQFMDQVSPVT
jgi:putative PIN family toxin of toxin-antitoxin system